MAKHGIFSLSTDHTDMVHLASAVFRNTKYEPFLTTTVGTPQNIYRLSWFNLHHAADCGSVEGIALGMVVGQAGHRMGTFKFGETYVFRLAIFCVDTKGQGAAIWRTIKPKLSRKFAPALAVQVGGVGTQIPLQVEWLIPVAHEIML